MYRPIPNKFTKQFPEINSSLNRLIRFSQTYCYYDTMMKSYSPKRTPNIVTYRKYTNFDKDKFIDEISIDLARHNLQELTLEARISMFEIVFEKRRFSNNVKAKIKEKVFKR